MSVFVPALSLAAAARFWLRKPSRMHVCLGLSIIAVCFVFWPGGVFAGDPSFDDRQRFGSGLDRTQSIVAVDIDDDGDLDLAVGNFGQQSAVYLNDGRGRFHDGVAGDCATLESVLRCFGGAADAADEQIASGRLPDAPPIVVVAAGDMNGDSAPDIVAVTDGLGGRIYLNDGRGFLGRGRPFGPPAAHYRTLAIGDINGDARLDIVAGGIGLSLVLVNQGEGVFHEGPIDDCATPPTGVICLNMTATAATMALAPLDAGPSLDIIVGYNQSDGAGGQGVVYLNDGSGRFSVGAPETCSVHDSPGLPAMVCLGNAAPGLVWQHVAVGDIDAQAGFDIVAAFGAAPDRVFLSLSQGGFADPVDLVPPTTRVPTLPDSSNIEEEANLSPSPDRPPQPSALVEGGLVLVDLDGNGRLDVVRGRYGGQNDVSLGDAGGNRRVVTFGTGADATTAVVTADLDDDGDLDLAVGNWQERSAVYLNDGAGAFPAATNVAGGQPVVGLAAGDIDLDNDLDLVAAQPGGRGVLVHLNIGSGVFSGTLSIAAGRPSSLVLGDLNGDRYLDLILGSFSAPLSVYLYQPERGDFTAGQSFGRQAASGLALGDLNGDTFLDVTVGYGFGGNMAYLNDGEGNFSLPENQRRLGGSSSTTTSIAVGDLDGDSDLDVVAGNGSSWPERSTLYLNDGTGNFDWQGAERPLPGDAANTNSIAVGDLDGDGDLDIAAGNGGSAGRECTVFLNDGSAGFAAPRVIGNSAVRIDGIQLVDMDGDGDLDVTAARRNEEDAVYVNDGRANFPALRTFGMAGVGRKYLVAADIDSDGDADLISGGSSPVTVTPNRWRQSDGLPNQPAALFISRPDGSGAASLHATSTVLRDTVIPVAYRLLDSSGRAVRRVEATYSPGAGRQWEPALPTPRTVTRTLTTTSSSAASSSSHVFEWDTFASKLFDRSDRVVLRLKAYPGHQPAPNGLPEAGLWPYVSSSVGLLRVVGTQVEVVGEPEDGGKPLSGAYVFRLRAGETSGGQPLANEAGEPLLTNALGFLQGRAETGLGDRLVALWPVTQTYSYTLYYTSASPNRTGLSMAEVAGPGIQRLVVSKANPLVLFNLDVSLEWDARNDGTFLDDLEQAIIRSSETLYDVGDGQIALGDVRVFQAGDDWLNADAVIYASSGIRPRATLGGVVSQPTDDIISATQVITNAFWPGQIRMGPAWDPFGESRADLTSDWSRALAHEYGHHFLFLPDNYLGYNDNGYIVGVDCKGSFMTNTYEDSYSEFLTAAEWSPSADCARSIAARLTGRSDWQTISQYYGMLSPRQNPGPSTLPIDVTRILFMDPSSPSSVLPSRNFDLRSDDGARLSLSQGQAYLVERYGTNSLVDDRIMALGPIVRSDRVRVRGAREGDRVCAYDDSHQPPLWGCEQIRPWSASVTLRQWSGWRPSLQVAPVALPNEPLPPPAGARSPVTATVESARPVDLFQPGIAITVTLEQPLLSAQQLYAQVLPAFDPAGGDPTGAVYGQLSFVDPANPLVYSGVIPLQARVPSGFVRVWVPGTTEAQVLRESVSQFFLTEDWGRPGSCRRLVRGTTTWPRYARTRSGDEQTGLRRCLAEWVRCVRSTRSGCVRPTRSGCIRPTRSGCVRPTRSGCIRPTRSGCIRSTRLGRIRSTRLGRGCARLGRQPARSGRTDGLVRWPGNHL